MFVIARDYFVGNWHILHPLPCHESIPTLCNYVLKKHDNIYHFARKRFSAEILFYKKFLNSSQIKFLKFLLESDNFLLNIIFDQTSDVEVNHLTSVSASAEDYREVGCSLSCTII